MQLESNLHIYLSQDKTSLKLGPEDYLYVEGFASNVFAKADKQDRAGRADLYSMTPLIHQLLKFQNYCDGMY